MRRQGSLWTRLLALFLLWSSLRAVWSVFLAEVDPNYRLASELGFGPLFVGGQVVYALFGVTAAAAVWWRWRRALPLGTVAAVGVGAPGSECGNSPLSGRSPLVSCRGRSIVLSSESNRCPGKGGT